MGNPVDKNIQKVRAWCTQIARIDRKNLRRTAGPLTKADGMLYWITRYCTIELAKERNSSC